jgi:hypothetical protein
MSPAGRRLCERGIHSWTRELRVAGGAPRVVRICQVCGSQEVCWSPAVFVPHRRKRRPVPLLGVPPLR